jgi:myotubularin-related protein 1/2
MTLASGTDPDDPLTAALEEAESLMESLGDAGAADDANNIENIGSFAIDSDDEGDEIMGLLKSEDLHPLHDDFLATTTTTTTLAPSPGTAPPASASSISGNMSGAPLAPQEQHQQPIHSFSSPNMESLRQQTKTFATNLAGLAHRAASQVTTAVQTTTAAAATAPHASSSWSTPMSTTNASAVVSSSFLSPLGMSTSSYATGTASPAMTPVAPPDLDSEQKETLIRTHVGSLIPGERVIMFLHLLHVSDSTGLQYNANQHSGLLWCCAMTYYRIILFSTHPVSPPPKPPTWNFACWPQDSRSILQMPLADIEKVEKSVFTSMMTPSASSSSSSSPIMTANSNAVATTMMGLTIISKHSGWQIRFTTANFSDTNRVLDALQNYAFPGRRNLGYLFAFESKREDVMASIQTDEFGKKTVTLPPYRKRFDGRHEYQRQFANAGNQPNPWSIWNNANGNYQLCSSYPSILAGPASLDDTLNPDARNVVTQTAAFRSEQRLPVLTWCGMGGGSIWRSSQPKVGLQGNRSPADELFLKHVADASASASKNRSIDSPMILPPRSVLIQLVGSPDLSNWMPNNSMSLKILDLRPRSAAMANRTGGYGYENTSNYMGCSLQFCNIGNIHAVRDAYQKLSSLCLSTVTSDISFASALEDTKWLSHIRLIWAAAWETAYWVHLHRLPVLVHCSHGWDRTSQVVALAEILLDPFYRTIEGFSCLIEKDFLSFGHPFHTRCGHGEGKDGGASTANGVNNSTLDEGQISPIFIQFLDCVFQIVNLYPECFEYNTKYILCLSEHIYSCRFGNFLCDTERERELMAGIRQRTNSVWDYLENRTDLTNRQFSAERSKGVMLMPLPTLLRNITLWTDRHCAYGSKASSRWLPEGITRPNHPLDHDQPSTLVTEYETKKLIFSMAEAPSIESTTNTVESNPGDPDLLDTPVTIAESSAESDAPVTSATIENQVSEAAKLLNGGLEISDL